MGNTNEGISRLRKTTSRILTRTSERETSAEQQPEVSQSLPEAIELQPEEEQQGKETPTEQEGAVALPPPPGKVEQFQREEESSLPPRDSEPPVDPEVTGFVYHEMELVYNIHTTMKEMEDVMEKIESARRNVEESSEDLKHTYVGITEFLRCRSPLEEFVERAISKLEENIGVQEKVTEGFSIAADRINKAVKKLNQQVESMTSDVVAKMPEEIIRPPVKS